MNFLKGLLTEASKLNQPDNYFRDGDNIELFRDGTVARRLAIGGETDFSYSLPVDKASTLTNKIQTFSWTNPAGDGSKRFLVYRFGQTVYFYDITDGTASGNLTTFNINLQDYSLVAVSLTSQNDVRFVAENERLYIAGGTLEPIFAQYDAVTDSLSVQQITIEVRDFEDADTTVGVTTELTTLTAAQEYDLANRGWVSPGGGQPDPKATYFTAKSEYPPKSKAPWQGTDATNTFDSTVLEKSFAGNNSAATGRYIINFFNKDRSTSSGIASIPTVAITTRPTEVSFYAGRVWYLWKNRLFFTQAIETNANIGKCYQVNDPTNETLSDLLDADGGTFIINDLAQGIRMEQLGSALVIYGDNGVWTVSGENGVFKATAFFISKSSNEGIESPDSLVKFKTGSAYWSSSTINIAVLDNVSGLPQIQSISEQTINKFYNEIPAYAKHTAKGVFDKTKQQLIWIYNGDTVADDTKHQYYNRILKFDVLLQAFVPQSIADTDYPMLTSLYTVEDAVSIDGTFSNLKFTVLVEDGTDVKWTFAEMNDTSFYDFKDFDGVGVSYSSYIEPGNKVFQDAVTYKKAPYIYSYFKRTEEAFVVDGSSYVFDRPSACTLRGKWEWSDSETSNKWTNNMEAYYFKRSYFVDPSDLDFDYGFDIILTKRKLRGKGRALRVRYESQAGKDFQLQGWSLVVDRYTDNG